MAKKKHNEDVILRIIVDESKKIGKNITPEMIVSLCVDVAKKYAEQKVSETIEKALDVIGHENTIKNYKLRKSISELKK